MNSSSLSPLSRYMRYNTRISSRSSLSRSASENFCSNCCKPRELHGAVDLAPALLSQIGLHGLEQVAVGGVVPAAAQRRHHPAQLPHIDVELRLRRGRRRLLAAAVAQD